MTPKDNSKATRLKALRRFATTITILNVVGHIYLGFEQSWAQPLVALATTYSMELLLELIDARTNRRPLAFAGGMRNLVDFLLPAHITGLSIAMLLWANDQLWPFAFAAAVATGSKAILRVPIGKSTRHFLNPSNLGITMTLILLPWVGFAPPYEFTENLTGVGYWILPGLIIVLGTMVNRLTGRLPLIAAWVGGFVLQACLRSVLFGLPVVAALLPMTGVMFVIYTFYMITDPGTTPTGSWEQVAFGAGVAAVYGLLIVMHVVAAIFIALTLVCALRGLGLFTKALLARRTRAKAVVQEPTAVSAAKL
ncbi:MAG: enediyne biosynthesis protein UnbU [Ktedonobacteraceae bacterium]